MSVRPSVEIESRFHALGRICQEKGVLRLLRFGVVGASGVLVNMGLLIVLTEALGWPYPLSSLFAIEGSILSNFYFNNRWTWGDRRQGPWPRRLAKYHLVAGFTALVANWGLLVALTHWVGMDYRLANLVGIVAGILLNFLINHHWTFRNTAASAISPLAAQPAAPCDRGVRAREPQTRSAGLLGLDQVTLTVVAGLLVLTAVKLALAAQANLVPEEAYYWMYAQHPALGYYDHPPMVAWIIILGTRLLGDTELGVRLGTILLSLGSSGLLFWLGRRWFGTSVGLWTVALFNALPIFIGTGLFAFPDGPLGFFWLLTLVGLTRALGLGAGDDLAERREERPPARTIDWLLAGVGLGGALLSKYTAVMLVPSLGLFLLWSPQHRRWLLRPQPWLAGLLGLLLFLPVVVWNAQNGWASFLFQSGRTADGSFEPWRTVPEFWLLQVGALGPVAFVLFLWVSRKCLRWAGRDGDAVARFAVSQFLPLFVVFVYASLKTEVRYNWTAQAYLGLLPLMAAAFVQGLREPAAARWRHGAWAAAATAVVFVTLTGSVLLWGQPSLLVGAHLRGWPALGAAVNLTVDEMARNSRLEPFVIGVDKYRYAAELGFYGPGPHDVVNTFALNSSGLGFRFWTDLKPWQGHPAVAVLKKVDEDDMNLLRAHFDRVASPERCELPGLRTRHKTRWIVRCYGYHVQPRPSPQSNAGRNPSASICGGLALSRTSLGPVMTLRRVRG